MTRLPDIITFSRGLEYGKRKNLSTAKDALQISFFRLPVLMLYAKSYLAVFKHGLFKVEENNGRF